MSRWVPSGGPPPESPDEPDHGQGYDAEQGGQLNGYGYDGTGRASSGRDQYGRTAGQYGQYGQAGYRQPGYDGGQGYGQQPQRTQGRDYTLYQSQDYREQSHDDQRYGEQGYREQGYGEQGYGEQGYGHRGYPARDFPGQGYPARGGNGSQYGGDAGPTAAHQYQANAAGYPGEDGQRGYPDGQARGNMRRYSDGERYPDDEGYQNGQGYTGQGRPDGPGYSGGERYPGGAGYRRPDGGPSRPGQGGPGQPGQPGQPGRPGRHGQSGRPGGPGQRPGGPGKVRFGRTRRLFRRPSVRIASAIVAVLLAWLLFSVGQAAFKNNGQSFGANIAEWARDHNLGFIVTFAEQLGYSPPAKGGKPSFSYAVPSGQGVTPLATKGRKGSKSFVPDIPAPLKPLAAGAALPGEGQWRVVEKVKGYPAILTTLLRDGGQYTSYSNGIASLDQRLVRFSLRPGTEDPGSAPNGSGNWGVPNYIPSGQYAGLLATFNGAFKLDAAKGGFYLNGMYHGSLATGAASVVYYKNGTVKVGEWGRDFTMSSKIVGVRQNLKLLVDHGKVASNSNSDVTSNWGATLGGSYWVWRSGLGITKDGRIVYVYGQALDAQDLALLLQRAGAFEGMQMDINPSWMKFDIYTTHGNTAQPSAVPLLPTQQPSVYSYLTPSTRDFTAVYAR
jgi:hypothetical protein